MAGKYAAAAEAAAKAGRNLNPILQRSLLGGWAPQRLPFYQGLFWHGWGPGGTPRIASGLSGYLDPCGWHAPERERERDREGERESEPERERERKREEGGGREVQKETENT